MTQIVITGALAASALFAQQVVSCGSDNMKRNTCAADTRRGVTLAKQRSDSPCIQGRTWGYTRDNIWVDRGCRADFVLGSGGPGYGGVRPPYGPGNGYGPGQGQPSTQTLTCSSDDGKRHWCGNSTNGRVRLVRQISGSPCTEGYSWGTQPGSVWVDRGCRADFEISSGRRR